MRSTSRRRAGLAALVLAVTATACSDDDGAGDATSVGAAATTASALDTAAPDPVASVTTGGETVTTQTVITEPVVPTLDDTVELGGTQLSTVDLTTGAATAIGRIGGEDVGVLGLAFVPGATTTAYGLTDAPELVTFDIADPSTLLTAVPVEGVAAGSTLLSLDVDPADGTLYALSDAAVLYAVDPATGVATPVGTGLGEPLADPGFGFDVDPTTGLLRVEVATGEHLLVVPATGSIDADPESVIGQPAYDPADAGAAVTPRVVAVAFTANGELYAIDAATGNLVLQDPPDAGVLTTVGPLGIDLTDGASFDISPTGRAIVASPG